MVWEGCTGSKIVHVTLFKTWGGLNWAHDSKLTSESLMAIGDWRSTAYLNYLDVNFDRRKEAAREMVEKAAK